MLTLKNYQHQALESLRAYFQECSRTDDALGSFTHITQEFLRVGKPYVPVRELPGLPYVCLRVPTGGGKTLMACHAVGAASRELLQAERCVVLWLVPSNVIREQTLKALKDRRHHYRQALDSHFGSVAVLDIPEALYVQRATLEAETTIIVSTLQAFRVEDTEGRKVYETNGQLQSHFAGLSEEAARGLDRLEDGSLIPSLANVLRLRRPVVVVDEAHNARTSLSFETLARFNPSCIVEFTATPDTDRSPSNVLYSCSAAELQAEQMIKMPIRLETRPNWKELLTDAVAALSQLELAAQAERQMSGEYIRPIMLLQAQPHDKDKPTITYEVVKNCLLTDHRIPEDEIAIATGDVREIDDVDLSKPDCKIRYIITVQALREGWDCPFAYILCSVAEMRSSTAVEQILGRVMRLPGAKRKEKGPLNIAYAFVASGQFAAAAKALTDALVECGFNPLEAQDLIVRVPVPQQGPAFFEPEAVTVPVSETPDLMKLPGALMSKVSYESKAGELSFQGVMGDREREALLECFSTLSGKSAVEKIYRQSQVWPVPVAGSPAERGEVFSIPWLAIKQGEFFEAFEDDHLTDKGWNLSGRDASLSEGEFPSVRPSGEVGEIALDAQKKLTTRFVSELQQQMVLIAGERWNVGQLLSWMECKIMHQDLEPNEIAQFLQRLVRNLLGGRGLSLDYLVYNKYRLLQAAGAKIEFYRRQAKKEAYQSLLLPECLTPLVVSPAVCFSFDPNGYPYNSQYQGAYQFKRHYYKHVGNLGSEGEEYECALFIDNLPEIKYWVRNLERKTGFSFWLQTSTDRFYPDFVCMLNDGRFLVVEYKSELLWSTDDSEEKRDLGELWEARSEDRCLFVMPKGKDFAAIKTKVTGTVS